MTDRPDISHLPPLHPDRVACALEVMSDVYAKQMPPKDLTTETVICVLRQCRRAQIAIGLTSEVATTGAHLFNVAGALSRLVRHRR